MLEPSQFEVCRLIVEEVIEEFLSLDNYSDVKTMYLSMSASMPNSEEMLEIVAASLNVRLIEYPFVLKSGVFNILNEDEYFFKFSKDKHYNEFQRKVPKSKTYEEDTFWNF